MYLKIHPENPSHRQILKACEVLRKGGVLVYPTDTVYALGCDIYQNKAADRIARIKGIRLNKADFSFIFSDLSQLSDYTRPVSNTVFKMMKAYLPGPYTFILEGSRLVPKIMLTKRKTAGIRVPDNSICLSLVNELGNPLLTTSATKPDGTIFHDASLIHDFFGKRIDAVVDGSIVPGQPSSVISLIEDTPEVIRKGIGDVSIFE